MRRIVDLGNEQLRAGGPESLSVREIARGLGMVSSAVYRYVSSRDELLTLLLVDAYHDLADAVDAALAEHEGEQAAERFDVLALAVRRWALAQPARWTLLYGTPVRGYAAPSERTNGPGTRVLARLAAIVHEVHGAEEPEISAALSEVLEGGLHDLGADGGVGDALQVTLLWSALLGMIHAELSEAYGADVTPVAEELFTLQLQMLRRAQLPTR